MIASTLRQAKEKFAPDRRTVVFDVDGIAAGDRIVLRGEVHSDALKELLLQYVRQQLPGEIVDSIRALPDPALGNKVYAVVSLSVANIRTKPAHPAEMGTQALLGTPLKVLKQEDDWYYVQTPDEYLGWTDDRIVVMDPDAYRLWREKPKVVVTTEFGYTREAADARSQPVSDVVIGSLLAFRSAKGSYVEVEYPDGRTGFLPRESVEPFDRWLREANDTPQRVVATAKRFMGVPYFWGGTSSKGMDCSGFSKTVYYLNGVLLPRDANQQATVGDPVEPVGDWADVSAGDLLFFGARAREGRSERITHVAISLGGKRFIHASGGTGVCVNSLDPSAPDYSPYRERSFLRIKRIIGAGEQSGVRRLARHPYYQSHER